MPVVSQDTIHQPARTSTGPLEVEVMIEFQGQEVDVGKRRGELAVPRAKVGRIGHPPTGAVKPESKCRSSIVGNRQGPAAHSGQGVEAPSGFEIPQQTGKPEGDKIGGSRLQRFAM